MTKIWHCSLQRSENILDNDRIQKIIHCHSSEARIYTKSVRHFNKYNERIIHCSTDLHKLCVD